MEAAAGTSSDAATRDYPPEEWRITGELIRQIAKAQTWQRVVEAGDALMHVERMAASLRSDRDFHAAAESQRTETQEWLCLGGHKWVGLPESCCPECNRRPSTHAIHAVSTPKE